MTPNPFWQAVVIWVSLFAVAVATLVPVVLAVRALARVGWPRLQRRAARRQMQRALADLERMTE